MKQRNINILLVKYKNMLYKAARQRYLKPIYEDALSEACISFLQAVKNYDTSTGVPFHSYAKIKVYSDLRTFFNREKTYWQHQQTAEFSADSTASLRLADHDYQKYLSQETTDTLETNTAILTPKQKTVIYYLYHLGLSQREIALKLHLSHQTISRLHKKALQNLRKQILKEAD